MQQETLDMTLWAFFPSYPNCERYVQLPLRQHCSVVIVVVMLSPADLHQRQVDVFRTGIKLDKMPDLTAQGYKTWFISLVISVR